MLSPLRWRASLIMYSSSCFQRPWLQTKKAVSAAVAGATAVLEVQYHPKRVRNTKVLHIQTVVAVWVGDLYRMLTVPHSINRCPWKSMRVATPAAAMNRWTGATTTLARAEVQPRPITTHSSASTQPLHAPWHLPMTCLPGLATQVCTTSPLTLLDVNQGREEMA